MYEKRQEIKERKRMKWKNVRENRNKKDKNERHLWIVLIIFFSNSFLWYLEAFVGFSALCVCCCPWRPRRPGSSPSSACTPSPPFSTCCPSFLCPKNVLFFFSFDFSPSLSPAATGNPLEREHYWSWSRLLLPLTSWHLFKAMLKLDLVFSYSWNNCTGMIVIMIGLMLFTMMMMVMYHHWW